jgi:hypothetical protein
MAFDGAAFGEGIVQAIKSYVDRENAALRARIAALEARPIVKYVGVWRAGKSYEPGSMATDNGSLWHANGHTTSRPGTDNSWTLAVKRGNAT